MLTRDLILGGFTEVQLSWMEEELGRKEKGELASAVRSGRQRGRDRRRKGTVKYKIAKASATLLLSSYYHPVFGEAEWEEMLPPELLAHVVHLGCVRGGYDYATPLVDAIHKGVNEYVDVASEGLVRVQVGMSLVPAKEKLDEVKTKVGMRVLAIMREQVRKEAETEKGPPKNSKARKGP